MCLPVLCCPMPLTALSGPSRYSGWPWPEQRLTYANATLPEAMIAAGTALERPVLLASGLDLLEWLLDRENRRWPSLGHPGGWQWSRRPWSILRPAAH